MLAQEFTYRSSLAILPRFFDETALANLLYCYDPELIRLPFAPNFNLEIFKDSVKSALSKFANIASVDELFKMKDGFEIESILSKALSDKVPQLYEMIDNRIQNLTLRFSLYNGLPRPPSAQTNPNLRLNQKLMEAFFNELRIRYGSVPQSRLIDLRFEKNSFGALFQFIYNNSSVIADSLKSRGLAVLRLDDPELVERHKKTILTVMEQEKQLAPLLTLLGQPNIVLRKKTDNINVLGLQWSIERLTTTPRRDLEFIHVEFVGQPIPRPEQAIAEIGLSGGGDKKEKFPIDGGPVVKSKPSSRKSGRFSPPLPVPKEPSSSGIGEGEIGIGKGKIGEGEGPKPIPAPEKVLVQAADLAKTKPPDHWQRKLINLSKDDVEVIKAFDVRSRVAFNLTPASFSMLNKPKAEFLRFIKHFIEVEERRGRNSDEILQSALPLLAQETWSAYLGERDQFLRQPEIRILRHMMQKFIFLSYISNAFNNAANVSVLNQDILEMSLRTILSKDGAEYDGYEFFVDLKNSLAYLLKYIQDLQFFYHNAEKRRYGDITIEVSPSLIAFMRERFAAINTAIGDESLKIAGDEAIVSQKINLRNLITQLEKIKYTPAVPALTARGETLFQPEDPCDCDAHSLRIYECVLFADGHVIVSDEDNAAAKFDDCFSKYFALDETKKMVEPKILRRY